MRDVLNDRKTWIAAQVQAIRNGKSDGFHHDRSIICPSCGFEQDISKVASIEPFPCWPVSRVLECQQCRELFHARCHVKIEYSTVRFDTG